jgi:predicted component of type VI protein secretion system
MSTARLVLRYGPFPSQEYILPQQTVTIGREQANDLKLTDPEISRRHARILYQASRYLIEDLGSANGTFVNGRRIETPTVLRPGDVIDFAEYVGFTFEAAGLTNNTLVEPRDAAPAPHQAVPASRDVSPPLAPTLPDTPPPLSRPPVASAAVPAPVPARRNNRMQILAGCGCLIFLFVFLCAATIFLLDRQAPDVLYCQLLRPLFEIFQMPLDCP